MSRSNAGVGRAKAHLQTKPGPERLGDWKPWSGLRARSNLYESLLLRSVVSSRATKGWAGAPTWPDPAGSRLDRLKQKMARADTRLKDTKEQLHKTMDNMIKAAQQYQESLKKEGLFVRFAGSLSNQGEQVQPLHPSSQPGQRQEQPEARLSSESCEKRSCRPA